MKKPFLATLSCLALIAAFPACDQHTWEDTDDGKNPGTKRLFEKHGDAGEKPAKEGEAHDKDHGPADEKKPH